MKVIAQKYRRAKGNQTSAPNEGLYSENEAVPLRLNSKDFVRTTGSVIGIQSRVRQTVANTNDIIGAEFSPRSAGVGTGALIALRADPVLQTASAIATVSAVRGVEVNIDFPDSGSAYTITNNINAFRTFLDVGAGHTISGVKAVLCVATPNTAGWDFLIDSEASAGLHVVGAGTYSTADGYFIVRVAGSTYRMPFFTAVD